MLKILKLINKFYSKEHEMNEEVFRRRRHNIMVSRAISQAEQVRARLSRSGRAQLERRNIHRRH